MIKLDENLLKELGLDALPKEEKGNFLKHIYETLEMRVGTRLAERMTEAQMTEFEQFIQNNDEQGAFQWLESNFPNYKEVVAEEFEKLKAEITTVSGDIVAASQAEAAGQQPLAE
jgi:predicted RNA-binding Zn ribbon-like protein